MTDLPIPMPNDTFDGGIVLASTWVGQVDDDGTELPDAAVLIVMLPAAPFYRVVDVEQRAGAWVTTVVTRFEHLGMATDEYAQRGADW